MLRTQTPATLVSKRPFLLLLLCACLLGSNAAASCPDQPALSPIGGLTARPGPARQHPARLEGAFMGVGYIEACAADYYSYNEFSSHDVPQVGLGGRRMLGGNMWRRGLRVWPRSGVVERSGSASLPARPPNPKT